MKSLVSQVIDPRLADLLSIWRDAAAAPSGFDDPLALFSSHADHLLLIDSDAYFSRYHHYGQAFARHFGADLTGQIIDLLPPDILPADQRGMLEFEYGFARRERCVLWRSYTARFPHDRTETWQRLVLPLPGGRLAVGAYPQDCPTPASDPNAPAGDGLLRLLIERVPVILDAQGDLSDLALSLRYFSSTQQHLSELEVLASTDPLTETANLRHFHHLAALELDHARLMGRSFSLLVLDIDHFKAVNDTHGHAAGDLVLRHFVDNCRHALRELDILGRCGGEEFSVALPNTGTEAAVAIAERLRQQVEQGPAQLADGSIQPLTVSIGVATITPGEENDDLTIPALMAHADAAMYRSKRQGRNRVSLAHPDDLKPYLDQRGFSPQP